MQLQFICNNISKEKREQNVVSFLSFLDPSYDYFISYRHNIDHELLKYIK